MSSADLLLHPVRLRIVQAFLGERALTTAQLAAELDDVPAGSLYRHVALLAKAGVLQVVAERRVRAAVERTYMLRLFAVQIGPDEAAAMTPAGHAQAFMAYVAGLLKDADRYLTSGVVDPVRDGADYRMGALWLTDSEYSEFLRDLRAVFQPRVAHAPGGGRRRRLVYTVFLPAPEKPASNAVASNAVASNAAASNAAANDAVANDAAANDTAANDAAASNVKGVRGRRARARNEGSS